tara:strand:+ start:807 stop:1229 length:423 start_codon:yes stop_codon:yes gene_type:complete
VREFKIHIKEYRVEIKKHIEQLTDIIDGLGADEYVALLPPEELLLGVKFKIEVRQKTHTMPLRFINNGTWREEYEFVHYTPRFAQVALDRIEKTMENTRQRNQQSKDWFRKKLAQQNDQYLATINTHKYRCLCLVERRKL